MDGLYFDRDFVANGGMITDIPTSEDYEVAGLNQLFLAWQFAMRALQDYEEGMEYAAGGGDEGEIATEYWQRSQPMLANAYSLIQQGMELALKARIAAVSPFLLIGHDPKDWPKGVDTGDVSFGEFRTLDAVDLVKVHNTFCIPPLDAEFKEFWDQVRRERNKIMHSAKPKSFEPGIVVKTILSAAKALFTDESWAAILLRMEGQGTSAALGFVDDMQNTVMRHVDLAIKHLTPADAKHLLGYDDDRRPYICPECYWRANRDWQDSWPHLAQFTEKKKGATSLRCVVCETTTEVERLGCKEPDCKGDVIAEGMCLTCGSHQ